MSYKHESEILRNSNAIYAKQDIQASVWVVTRQIYTAVVH